MKTTIGAILVAGALLSAAPVLAAGRAVTPAKPQAQTSGTASAAATASASAEGPAGLDERLGCGVMLVTLDEVLQKSPQLASKLGQSSGGAAMVPMLRMLGASGGAMLDQAYEEGASQGLKPTALYRRGVASLTSVFANLQSSKGDAAKEQAMVLFSRCVSIAAPKT